MSSTSVSRASGRSGTISAGGQTFTVNQAAAPCTFALSPPSASLGPSAGGGSFVVTTASGCAWTPVLTNAWIHSLTSGAGSGTVDYTVDANTGSASRSGVINVGGQIFTIFVITDAVAEAAVGLGILIALFRNKETVQADQIDLLKW